MNNGCAVIILFILLGIFMFGNVFLVTGIAGWDDLEGGSLFAAVLALITDVFLIYFIVRSIVKRYQSKRLEQMAEKVKEKITALLDEKSRIYNEIDSYVKNNARTNNILKLISISVADAEATNIVRQYDDMHFSKERTKIIGMLNEKEIGKFPKSINELNSYCSSLKIEITELEKTQQDIQENMIVAYEKRDLGKSPENKYEQEAFLEKAKQITEEQKNAKENLKSIMHNFPKD